MSNTRGFWLSQMLLLVLLYVAAVALALSGQTAHLVVRAAMLVLAAHLLEIPLAFYVLRDRRPQIPRVVIATLLFGLLWWLPAKRGLFATN